MTPEVVAAAAIVILLVLILLGMQVGLAMLVVSLAATAMIRSDLVAFRMIGSVANESLRNYLFAVVPLFVLMGLLVTQSGVGKDTFDLFERLMRKLRTRAGLGISTVFANAIFASITGISIASATVFSRVAVPEMRRHGYTRRFATGVVAGSSVLGMLIPPSLLLIVYAALAEQSVGRMFLAGVGPGLLLVSVFSTTILLLARFRPGFVFELQYEPALVTYSLSGMGALGKTIPILALVVLVLGGLYGGLFNPTEAAAAGALGALVISLTRGSVTPPDFWKIMVETGVITVSVLFLFMAATFFSRMLALSGLPRMLADAILSGPIGPYGFLLLFLLLIIVLGFIIDSISIMLIVLPIALPIAQAAGFDLVWFGVMTVIAAEIGLLTPPFGLSVYAIRMALDDPELHLGEIFRGALPFAGAMLIALAILVAFPAIATWLTRA